MKKTAPARLAGFVLGSKNMKKVLSLIALGLLAGCAGSPWANANWQERGLMLQKLGSDIQAASPPPPKVEFLDPPMLNRGCSGRIVGDRVYMDC